MIASPSAVRFTLSEHCSSLQHDQSEARRLFVRCLFAAACGVAAGVEASTPPATPKIYVLAARIGPAQILWEIDRYVSMRRPPWGWRRLERKALASYTQLEIALGPAAKGRLRYNRRGRDR